MSRPAVSAITWYSIGENLAHPVWRVHLPSTLSTGAAIRDVEVLAEFFRDSS
jgi:hypothetical protein